ncbi:hypothetical protein ACSSS7_000203 [Eimeria intestinalis]
MGRAVAKANVLDRLLALWETTNIPEAELNECRIYESTCHMKWEAWGSAHTVEKRMRYAIGCRFDAECKACNKGADSIGRLVTAWMSEVEKVRDVSVALPCRTFDFSGVVCMLFAWLATLAWAPLTSLRDFFDLSKIQVSNITCLFDTKDFAQNSVFVPGFVVGPWDHDAHWLLIAASAACGAKVYTDKGGYGTSSVRDYALPDCQRSLGEAIITALDILAESYDQAGAAPVFALACIKGLHFVETVVAHSHEGGLLRDMLRALRFRKPSERSPSLARGRAASRVLRLERK